MFASQCRGKWAVLAAFALVLACADDDPDAPRKDAGQRDAGGELSDADGGSDPEELARRLAEVERALRDAQERLTELTNPGDQELLTHLAQPLMAATCAHAARCCTRAELVLQLGDNVRSAEACEAHLLSWAQRATSLDVKGVSAAIFQRVSEALALQRSTGFEVDAEAVQACADALADAPCDHAGEERCVTPDRDDPCLPGRLLRSVARSGDACEPSSGLPQCAPGLACKALPGSGGRCTEAGKVGDACAQNVDCANEALFCGPTTRRCERRRELGESCAHKSPDTALDTCAWGLVCDTGSCVPACQIGAPCDTKHDNRDCAEGLVCVGWSQQCGEPNRGECARDSECNEGFRCTSILSTDGPYCFPILAPGDACGHENLACAPGLCVTDPVAKRDVCKATCTGHQVCASDEYCANGCGPFYPCQASQVGCNPRLPDGSSCFVSETPIDRQCASGHCDRATKTCQPRGAADSACERSAQCPTTQYCEGGMCVPLLAADADCAGRAADACGLDSFCRNYAAKHSCAAIPHQGDACDVSMDLNCAEGLGLTCVAQRCLPERERPLDEWCSVDANCASGFCSRSEGKCRQPLAEGALCQPPGRFSMYDECDRGLYCGSTGKCRRRGKAGETCDQTLAGRDCLSSKGPFEPGKCIERASEWRCDADALTPGSVLCDGQ